MSVDNGKVAAKYLKENHPSDDIVLDREGYGELTKFRDEIVGEDINLIHDVIWSGTVPLKDFIVSTEGDHRMRFCIFEDALEALEEVPEGKTAMVGAVQELGYKHFWLLGVTKGENRADMSIETYNKDGDEIGSKLKYTELIREMWRMWHGIQLALLHPKIKEVFAHPRTAKEYSREKDANGKRRRVVRYVKRHVVNGEEFERSTREINRQCLSWYVVGHWRHLKSGGVTYVRGHWRGELRAMKKNIDKGRERQLVV